MTAFNRDNLLMTAFNRANSKLKAIETRQRQNRTKAKLGMKDYKAKHPDWCRDANQDNYTLLNKKIKEDTEKEQVRNETFTRKLHQDG